MFWKKHKENTGVKTRRRSGAVGHIDVFIIAILTVICTVIAGMWMLEQAERNLYSHSTANAEKFNIWYRQILGELRIYRNYIERAAREGTPYMVHIHQSYKENLVYPLGVYMGTISGKYIDASGWEPPKDYSVKDRPWFIDALKSVDFTIGEPYIDAQTGRSCVTISTRVSDMPETTVMAVDVYLDYARELVDYIAGRDMIDGAIFITKNNKLIVADSNMRGDRRDFRPWTELQKKLADVLDDRVNKQTKITVDGETFYINIHYIDGINWYLVSYVEASTIWKEVAKSFAVIFGLELMILLLITVVFRQKEVELDESMDEVELRGKINDVLTKDYFVHAVIDVRNDTYRVFYERDFVREQITSRSEKASECMARAIDTYAADIFRPMLHKFIDLSTLPERLKDKPRLTMEYYSKEENWCRVCFLPLFSDDDGNITHVLYSVQSTEGEILYLRDKLRIEETLIECIRSLTGNPSFEDASQRLLRILGEYYKADRVYIYTVDRQEKVAVMEQEWCADGVTSTFAERNRVSLEVVENWNSLMDDDGKIVIDDMKAPAVNDNTKLAEYIKYLAERNVRNLCHVRIGHSSKDFRGIIGIENRSDNLSTELLLTSISSFVSEELMKRDYTHRLYDLSYKDVLTGVMNRHAYIRDITAMNEEQIKNVGIIFVDVNGLKQTNDQLGHEAGDEIIKRAANLMKERFGTRSVYRLGGDEFVAICQAVNEEAFNEIVKEICTTGYGLISVGEAWIEVCTDLEQQVKIADHLMYQRKREYYESLGIDRRRR